MKRDGATLSFAVVEDNLADYGLLTALLSAAGIDCRCTRFGQLDELLDIDEWSRRFDLVLLDLNSPGGDWQQTLVRLSTEVHTVPVVVMTGTKDEVVGLQAIRAGAQDYLDKAELDGPTLKRTLRYAIERFRLVSDLRRAREREWRLANLDTLTGLPNRRLFDARLGQALREARRNGDRPAVLLIDLDRFKPINDSLGHAVGDKVLVELADRLGDCVREEDCVARLGGDEFIVMLRRLKRVEDAATVAAKLIGRGSAPIPLGEHTVAVGLSVGIAFAQSDDDTADRLVRYADLAMYNAKSAGGNMFRFYSDRLAQSAEQQMAIESDLREAIVRGGLALHYQPIVELASGRIVGQEALVRWPSKSRGLLAPESFIGLSEQSDLIVGVDDWVMQTACRDAARWPDGDGTRRPKVNINLSAKNFRQASRLVARVLDSVRRAQLSPWQIELEITETVFVEASEATIEALGELRRHGVRVAIDDFGVGYSSLNTLRMLPVDVLKLDRTFLRSVPGDGRSAALAAAIIRLGNDLGLEVVAEGVETDGQLAWLRDHGCVYAQGFRFARPSARPVFMLAH